MISSNFQFKLQYINKVKSYSWFKKLENFICEILNRLSHSQDAESLTRDTKFALNHYCYNFTGITNSPINFDMTFLYIDSIKTHIQTIINFQSVTLFIVQFQNFNNQTHHICYVQKASCESNAKMQCYFPYSSSSFVDKAMLTRLFWIPTPHFT